MASYAWDGIACRVRMPAVGGTTSSVPFTLPKGCKSLQVHVPALVGTGATIKLQALAPTETVEATEVWSDVKCFDLTDGTMETLDGLVESTCVTLPASATGGGVLKWVASEDQSGTPSTITMLFGMDG